MSTEKKIYNQLYAKTEAGKEAITRYRASEKGRIARSRYVESEKGKVAASHQQDSDSAIGEKATRKSQRYSNAEIELILTKQFNGVSMNDAEIALHLGRTRDGIVSTRVYYSKHHKPRVTISKEQRLENARAAKKRYRNSPEGKAKALAYSRTESVKKARRKALLLKKNEIEEKL